MAYLFDVIATLDKQIEQCYRQNALCQRIGKIPGIGPVTASALIATIGKANNFENGRQLAAGSDWFHVSTPVGVNKSCSG
jgi:transposase